MQSWYKNRDRYKKALRGGLRACNNLPQPNPYIGGCGRLLHALNPPRSAILYLQFLAQYHPYILLLIFILVSQRGDSPFVYRDGTGWPASLPYIYKICVSVAIGTQSGIRLHKGYLWSKYGGPQKSTKIGQQESC